MAFDGFKLDSVVVVPLHVRSFPQHPNYIQHWAQWDQNVGHVVPWTLRHMLLEPLDNA